MRPMRERRVRVRLPLNWPVCVRRNGDLILADLKDISPAGAFCWTPRSFQTGEFVELELLLPSELDPRNRGLRLRCRGPVVRSEEVTPGRYGFACSFEDYRIAPDVLQSAPVPFAEMNVG